MLRYVVYVSAATRACREEELREMLVDFRARNEAAGITGMLLYRDGDFIQAIEGPPEAVQDLLERLSWDDRHRGFLPLLSGTRESRIFGEWTMGFRVLNRDTVPEGYSEFLSQGLDWSKNPEAVHRLLESFRGMPVG